MTQLREKVRSLLKWLAEKLYNLVFTRGWKGLVLALAVLAAAVVLFALAFQGADYKSDPSSFVPRSVKCYVETLDLNALLRVGGALPVWKPDRIPVNDKSYNQAQIDLAVMIGEKVRGLGTTLPFTWLSGAKRAAMAMTFPDGATEEAWALYMNIDEPHSALSKIMVEQRLSLTEFKTKESGASYYQLVGDNGGTLFFAIVESWFIVSSSDVLPVFALDSLNNPRLSLGRTGFLPSWSGANLRAYWEPSYFAAELASAPRSRLFFLDDWLNPEARMLARVTVGHDALEVTLTSQVLTGEEGGGSYWFILFGILGTLLLLFLLAMVFSVIGLGGVLKFFAMKMGIHPAAAPAAVEPSAAFKEDAGIGQTEKEAVETKLGDGVITVETVVEHGDEVAKEDSDRQSPSSPSENGINPPHS